MDLWNFKPNCIFKGKPEKNRMTEAPKKGVHSNLLNKDHFYLIVKEQ